MVRDPSLPRAGPAARRGDRLGRHPVEHDAAGGADTAVWRWLPTYHVDWALRLDALAELMVLLAAGVGTLVLVYCASYFDDRSRQLGRFAGNLLAFTGAMLGLVLADDLVLLYIFWELTTVFSYLLIGQTSDHKRNRRSALQALTVTALGGLTMLVGFLLLGHEAGTYRVSAILADPPAPSAALSTAVVLILVGALSKSAIWPFSLWLPNAMAAPTPVSAYLHAARWSRPACTSSPGSPPPSPTSRPGARSCSSSARSRCCSAAGGRCGCTT